MEIPISSKGGCYTSLWIEVYCHKELPGVLVTKSCFSGGLQLRDPTPGPLKLFGTSPTKTYKFKLSEVKPQRSYMCSVTFYLFKFVHRKKINSVQFYRIKTQEGPFSNVSTNFEIFSHPLRLTVDTSMSSLYYRDGNPRCVPVLGKSLGELLW